MKAPGFSIRKTDKRLRETGLRGKKHGFEKNIRNKICMGCIFFLIATDGHACAVDGIRPACYNMPTGNQQTIKEEPPWISEA